MLKLFRRAHYEFLARFFAYELSVTANPTSQEGIIRNGALKGTARLLASRLEADNPNFDREKFLKACGL